MCEQMQAWGEESLSKLAPVLSRAPEVQHAGLRNREQVAKAPHKQVEVEEVGHMWEQVEEAPHRQVGVEGETHRQVEGEGALPQLEEEVGARRRVELAVVQMWEVEVVPRILVEEGASRTQALRAPPEEVHTLAGVVVVGVERSGCADGSGPCAWCGRCGRP